MLAVPNWTDAELLDRLSEVGKKFLHSGICAKLMEEDGRDPSKLTWNDLFEYIPSNLWLLYSDHKIVIVTQYYDAFVLRDNTVFVRENYLKNNDDVSNVTLDA